MPTLNYFRVAIEGNLVAAMAAEKDIAAKATTAAIKQAATLTRNNFRRQTARAGLGQGLEKAWQSKSYPESGNSLSAAGLVFSKSKRLHSAFSQQRTIKGPLLIPTNFAEENGLTVDEMKGRGGRARRVFNLPAAEARFGPLFSYKSPFGAVLLMGHTHKLSSRRGEPVALARIVPQVRLKRLLDLEGPPREFRERIPQYIVAAMKRAERPRPRAIRVTVG